MNRLQLTTLQACALLFACVQGVAEFASLQRCRLADRRARRHMSLRA